MSRGPKSRSVLVALFVLLSAGAIPPSEAQDAAPDDLAAPSACDCARDLCTKLRVERRDRDVAAAVTVSGTIGYPDPSFERSWLLLHLDRALCIWSDRRLDFTGRLFFHEQRVPPHLWSSNSGKPADTVLFIARNDVDGEQPLYPGTRIVASGYFGCNYCTSGGLGRLKPVTYAVREEAPWALTKDEADTFLERSNEKIDPIDPPPRDDLLRQFADIAFVAHKGRERRLVKWQTHHVAFAWPDPQISWMEPLEENEEKMPRLLEPFWALERYRSGFPDIRMGYEYYSIEVEPWIGVKGGSVQELDGWAKEFLDRHRDNVFAVPKSRCPLFLRIEGDGAITRGLILLSEGKKPEAYFRCLTTAYLNALGLVGRGCHYRPSALCPGDKVEALYESPGDLVLLALLYHPSLKPGMRVDEAMPIAQSILAREWGSRFLRHAINSRPDDEQK